MNTDADLKLLGVAEVDGRPLACTGCGNTFSLEVHKNGVFETSPAWVCCLACGHGGEDPTVTTGLVDAVLAARASRAADADRDTFTAEWRGTVMTGELVPLLDLHQIRGAAEAVYEVAAPEVKTWWRDKKREAKKRVKAPWRAAKRQARKAVDEAAAAAKVAALTTAWNLQTGSAGAAGPKPKRRRRCTVKGCRNGMLTIRTRNHSAAGKTQQVKVPCTVCGRAGE